MENQVNVGIQRQLYDPFETVENDAENSSANASLTDDSSGASTGSNPDIAAPHIDGEGVNPAPSEAAATNNTLNRYGIGDTIILGRPEYAMPDYSPVGNTTTAPNSPNSESPTARHDAASWMKEASISGSNDSGGSVDGGWDSGGEGDYGGGEGVYGGGGDVGGGDFDGGGDLGGDVESGSDIGGGDTPVDECSPLPNFLSDENGNPYTTDNPAPITDKHPNNSHGGSPNDYSGVDSYGIGEAALDADVSDTSPGATNSNDNSGMDSGSHGGASNDYLNVDSYGIAGAGLTSVVEGGSAILDVAGAGLESLAGSAVNALGEVAGTIGRVGVGIAAATMPGNAGRDTITTNLADGTRFVVGAGALEGRLEGRNTNGEWTIIRDRARLDYNSGIPRVALSDEDRRALNLPPSNVPSKPNPGGNVPPFVVPDNNDQNRFNGSTISPIQRPIWPGLPSYPGEPVNKPGDNIIDLRWGTDPARIPNGNVTVDGVRYNFDARGRVGSAEVGNLTLGDATRSRAWQDNAGGADRRGTDQGGHIVGNRFNPPNREFNFFAQNANFNMGQYRVMEAAWADAIRNGQQVSVEWRFFYPEDSQRPNRIEVTYRIGDGEEITEIFENEPRGGRK